MSILTTNEVAAFLGISSSVDGLQEAIDQAEALIAAKMRLQSLEHDTYTETRVLTYPRQQLMPQHGPIQTLTAFTVEGDDKLADVAIDSSKWSIRWDDPVTLFQYGRSRQFKRMAKIVYTYSAGWTIPGGSYPLPVQVREAIKSMTGLVYMNLLGSGVYDTKLGDMTIKIQRETLEKNLEVYDRMIGMHGRPY